MREHLFRAKRIYNNEWAYGNLVVDKNGEPHIVEFESVKEDGHHVVIDSDTPMFVIPETVGEYTGLTDKNGKRIFEGDVIKVDYDGWCNGLFDYQHLYSENYEVYFDDNHHAWFTRFPKFEEPLEMLWEYDESCEVIGTIFDEGERE